MCIRIYYFVRSKAKKIGKPFDKKSKKGRNFAISPYDYAAMFIISTFFDWSLRDDEFFSEVLCEKHVDHSTFGKAFAKIPYYYIKWLIFLTRNYTRNLIDEKPVLISDSTGVRTDRLYAIAASIMLDEIETKADHLFEMLMIQKNFFSNVIGRK